MLKTLFLATSVLLCTESHSAPLRLVTVSGECLRPVEPNRASYTVSIEIHDSSVKKASARATELYGKLKEEVQKLRLKDLELETTEYTLGEHREWENNKNVLKGYFARTGVKVETSEISKIGEVIDLAAKLGVQGGSLSVTVSREKWKSEYQECLAIAVQDSKKKAEKIAKAADSTLGLATQIEEEGTRPPPQPMLMDAKMTARAEMAVAPSIDVTNAKMTVSIQVSYELK